jgi:hypothetical protein
MFQCFAPQSLVAQIIDRHFETYAQGLSTGINKIPVSSELYIIPFNCCCWETVLGIQHEVIYFNNCFVARQQLGDLVSKEGNLALTLCDNMAVNNTA